MTSALGALPALLMMVVLLGIPPLLSMFVCARRAGRLRARGKPDRNYRIAALASLGAFVYNAAVLVLTGSALTDGAAQITTLHWLALALSWLCFWAWIVVTIIGRRRRRKVYY